MLATQMQVLNSEFLPQREEARCCVHPGWGTLQSLGWMSCKRSASSLGDRKPSPIQTARAGLWECLQVHGPWLEALTLPGCTRHSRAKPAKQQLSSIYTLLFQCHLQEGTAVWNGAIAHTAETSSHTLSVPPMGSAHTLAGRCPSLIPYSSIPSWIKTSVKQMVVLDLLWCSLEQGCLWLGDGAHTFCKPRMNYILVCHSMSKPLPCTPIQTFQTLYIEIIKTVATNE